MSKKPIVVGSTLLALLILGSVAYFLFTYPHRAPEGDIPFGFFEGSASFADSLTASSQLASVSSAVSRRNTGLSSTTTLSAARDNLKDALVNIICVAKNGGVRSISGSGVVISRDGVIITNSHIAQAFLLKDYPSKDNVVCVIRTGSPARTTYFAEPIYLSSSWITRNSTSLVAKNPKGSGKDDFALLKITRSATSAALPTSFPFVPLSSGTPSLGEQVAIGSYGAQSLTSDQIRTSLNPTLVLGSVKDMYTFTDSTLDLVSLGGSEAAQHGSSGGGVVDATGALVAVITTSSTEGAVASRDLRAITTGHIRRSFEEETGMTVDAYLTSYASKNLAEDFGRKIETLRTLLASALSGVAMR